MSAAYRSWCVHSSWQSGWEQVSGSAPVSEHCSRSNIQPRLWLPQVLPQVWRSSDGVVPSRSTRSGFHFQMGSSSWHPFCMFVFCCCFFVWGTNPQSPLKVVTLTLPWYQDVSKQSSTRQFFPHVTRRLKWRYIPSYRLETCSYKYIIHPGCLKSCCTTNHWYYQYWN